jgi:hypothetical protein
VEDSDFFEGVRARIIDKDQKPEWKHKSYKEVNPIDVIKRFFERSEEIVVDEKEENNLETSSSSNTGKEH